LQRFAKRRGEWQGSNCCRDLRRGEGKAREKLLQRFAKRRGKGKGEIVAEICEEEREVVTCKRETVAEISKEDRSMFGKGEEDTEISKEDRERARSILQTSAKRTERKKELHRFCTNLKITTKRPERGGYVHSAKTYKSLQKRQRGATLILQKPMLLNHGGKE
jgi:hypothetical protein